MQYNMTKGSLIALITFIFFGAIIPIAYRTYADLPLIDVLCWIGIIGLPFIWAILLISGKFSELRILLKQPKLMILGFIGAFGQVLSMVMFIYGVTSGFGLAVSMSYFVLPLFYVIVGLIIFHEKLSALMWLSLAIATIALLYGLLNGSQGLWIIPIICIGAVAFSTMRRIMNVDSVVALTFDYTVFSIAAIVTLLMRHGMDFLPASGYAWTGYAIIALANLVPLITLPLCIKYLPFNLVGVFAWLSPTLTFFISVFLWKEELNMATLISFIGIWAAMFLYAMAINKNKAVA